VIVRVENLLLKVDVLDLLVFKNEILTNALHRVKWFLFRFRVLNNVHFTKGAATDHLLDRELLKLSTWVSSVHKHGGSAHH